MAAEALRASLDDESLLNDHFKIIDTIVEIKVYGIRFDPIIERETVYWKQNCDRTIGNFQPWTRNYNEPAAFHYLRLISALKAIDAVGLDEDLPAVESFTTLAKGCNNLKGEREWREIVDG